MKTFTLEVITPEQTVFDGEITSLVVPAAGGDLGVWANHAALLTPIETGDVKVTLEGGGELHKMVSDGFLEVEHNHAHLLVEIGERADQIDTDRALRAEERARKRLHDERAVAGMDIARAEAALRRALTRQKISRGMKSTGS